jgi:CHAT domain-containing protein
VAQPLMLQEANLRNLRSSLRNSSFVHLATHAHSDPSNPNFSYLDLAGLDRIFSINLANLDFAGRHIFLSACETRIGENIAGDEPYGIADAFLAAGAHSVISTLWKIESQPTALFAGSYYRFLNETRSIPRAIAMAEREFIKGRSFKDASYGETILLSDPYYWAGFDHLRATLAADLVSLPPSQARPR